MDKLRTDVTGEVASLRSDIARILAAVECHVPPPPLANGHAHAPPLANGHTVEDTAVADVTNEGPYAYPVTAPTPAE